MQHCTGCRDELGGGSRRGNGVTCRSQKRVFQATDEGLRRRIAASEGGDGLELRSPNWNGCWDVDGRWDEGHARALKPTYLANGSKSGRENKIR